MEFTIANDNWSVKCFNWRVLPNAHKATTVQVDIPNVKLTLAELENLIKEKDKEIATFKEDVDKVRDDNKLRR